MKFALFAATIAASSIWLGIAFIEAAAREADLAARLAPPHLAHSTVARR